MVVFYPRVFATHFRHNVALNGPFPGQSPSRSSYLRIASLFRPAKVHCEKLGD